MNFPHGNLRMRSSDGARHLMRSVYHLTSLHHIFTVSTPRIIWSYILLLSSQCLHVSFSSCILLLLFSQCRHVASSSSYILLSSSSSWRCRHVNYFALTFYYCCLHGVHMSHYLALTFYYYYLSRCRHLALFSSYIFYYLGEGQWGEKWTTLSSPLCSCKAVLKQGQDYFRDFPPTNIKICSQVCSHVNIFVW